MPQNVKRRGFFSLISPFLVYYGVTLIVEIIAIMGIVLSNLPKLMEGVDVQSLENMQQMYVSEETMNMLLEQFMQHITLITAVSALCAIPFFFWMFRRDKKYELRIGIPQVAKAKAGRYIFIVLFSIAANIAFNSILILSNMGAYSEGYQEASTALYSGSFVVQLIGLGFITPIAEELMFRGLIYRRVRCMVGPSRAILISGLVFGLYHGNIVQGVYGVMVGCILAWLYEKYGSLKAPILFHICANLVSVIGTKVNLFTWIFQSYIRVVIITVVFAALGAAVFVVIRNMFMEPQKDIEIERKE